MKNSHLWPLWSVFLPGDCLHVNLWASCWVQCLSHGLSNMSRSASSIELEKRQLWVNSKDWYKKNIGLKQTTVRIFSFPKMPSQCYSNGLGNLGTVENSKWIQPILYFIVCVWKKAYLPKMTKPLCHALMWLCFRSVGHWLWTDKIKSNVSWCRYCNMELYFFITVQIAHFLACLNCIHFATFFYPKKLAMNYKPTADQKVPNGWICQVGHLQCSVIS